MRWIPQFGALSSISGCVLVLALVLAATTGALAQEVHPGLDFFKTDSTNTEFDFAPQPIAADFFGPGSDPFDGGVPAKAVPLPESELCPLPPGFCAYDDLSDIDTIVERLEIAAVFGVGQTDTIQLELKSLSLVSIAPITVTYNGGLDPELWDVEVCNSPSGSPKGEMVIEHTYPDGGVFDMILPFTPIFRFTRQSDGTELYLDGALEGRTDILTAEDVNWVYADFGPLSCRSNFCTPDPFTGIGLMMTHTVLGSCLVETPAMPSRALWILAGALAVLGLWVLSRVTRRAARAA